MVKGSDSKVFFELFKKPQEKDGVQKEELQPSAETAGTTPPQKVGTLVTQNEKPESKDLPTNPPPASASSEMRGKSGQSDPLQWIKNTSTEALSIEKKTEKRHTTPGQITPEPIPSKQTIATPPAPLRDEVVLRKDEVVLRQETLIIGAIAATFLSVACFFVGHKAGYNKGITNQAEEWLETIEPKKTQHGGIGQLKPIDAPKEKTTKDTASKVEKKSGSDAKLVIQDNAIIKDRWTIRVISYKNSKANVQRAKEIAGMLQESLGYSSFVVNTGKDLFVCVGEFDDLNSADLTKTQRDVANFEYQNKKQFSGCYPVRMR